MSYVRPSGTVLLSGVAKRLTLCSFSSRTVEGGGGEGQPAGFSCVIADARPGQSLACKIQAPLIKSAQQFH